MTHLRHAINLGLFLFAIWLLLSGHYTPLLLVAGLLSVLLVVGIATRIDLVDRETHYVLLQPSTLLYWVWLGREVVKSSIDVTRCILDPKLPISPTVIRVKASQRTDLGRTTHANSITLIPGTVSMDLDADTITVHALNRRYAKELESGDMDRRVSAVEKIF
jgi:multicomponent Na+:H+ antiporter subunit E